MEELENLDKVDKKNSTEDYVTVKAKTNFSSWSNVGWTLKKEDFRDIIPISQCEGTFDITVDGIHKKWCTTAAENGGDNSENDYVSLFIHYNRS